MPSPYQTPEQEFVERLGLLTEADGLPRIAGRILGFLLLRDTPQRATELAEGLSISHGSVSTNTRLLHQLTMIERVTVPGDRATYYQMATDPFRSLLAGQAERARRVHALVTESRRQVGPANPVADQRLREMARFYQLAIRATEDLLEAWEARRD